MSLLTFLNLTKRVSQTKIQTKILGPNITTTAAQPSLSFSNLVIGKWYSVNWQVLADAPTTTASAYLTLTHNSVIIGVLGQSSTGGIAAGRAWVGGSFKFQASSTTLLADSVSSSGTIQGNGTLSQTYIQLEELPNHEITTQWT